MSRREIRSFSFVLCLLLFWSHGFAQSRPTLAIPPLHSTLNKQAVEAIVQSFQKTQEVFVLDSSLVERYLRNRTKTSTPKKSTKVASITLKEGQEAYRRLQIKRAIDLLTQAKLQFRKELYEEESFEGLRSAQFHLAMAFLASKETGRAKEELRDIYILDPQRRARKVSAKLYPPNIRNLYQEVQKEMSRKKQAELYIKTKPPGAIVWVDGKTVGSSPVRVKRLPVGEHFLRLDLKGTDGFFGSKFVVEGSNQVDISLTSEKSIDMAKYFATVTSSNEIDHRRAAFLDDLGVALGTDILLFLSPGKAEVHGQLYDQRSQETSSIVKASAPEDLVAKLVQYLDAEGYVASVGEKHKTKARPSKKAVPLPTHLQPSQKKTFTEQAQPQRIPKVDQAHPWYQNPWIWLAVGASVLVLGGSILLFTDLAKSDASKSNLTLTIP